MPNFKTTKAFDPFRQNHKIKELPARLVANQDQVAPMTHAEGLLFWQDGPVDSKSPVSAASSPPVVTQPQADDKTLWVVRSDDVVYAPECCEFGASLTSGVIKHSNLTGGSPAYSGGELIFLDDRTLIVNGCSGRYGPKSAKELFEVADCFRASGYDVWNMGFDDDTGFPFPFVGVTPEWVD